MSIENLRNEYKAIRRQIVRMRPDLAPIQVDAMVRASLPANPGAFDWLTKITELHTLVFSAHNSAQREPEEYVDVDGYFGVQK